MKVRLHHQVRYGTISYDVLWHLISGIQYNESLLLPTPEFEAQQSSSIGSLLGTCVCSKLLGKSAGGSRSLPSTSYQQVLLKWNSQLPLLFTPDNR